jgi:hypothetical protein
MIGLRRGVQEDTDGRAVDPDFESHPEAAGT